MKVHRPTLHVGLSMMVCSYCATNEPGIRGLHLSTIQFNLSRF
jgi:hypothetical protein